MTLTTEQVQVPETTSPAPSPRPESPVRRVLRWAPVVVALGASGLLAVSVLTPDSGPARVDTSRTVAEYGSITAIDHRDELALPSSPSRTVAEYGSIAAIDHRNEPALLGEAASRPSPSTAASPPSSTATSGAAQRSHVAHRRRTRQRRRHRAPRRAGAAGGEATSRTVAEHGSVGAIEHRDDPALLREPRRAPSPNRAASAPSSTATTGRWCRRRSQVTHRRRTRQHRRHRTPRRTGAAPRSRIADRRRTRQHRRHRARDEPADR